MTVTERVAYLKGLYEGLGIDGTKKEGKVLTGVLETLEELAANVVALEAQNAELMDELDDVHEELSAVQETLLEQHSEDWPMHYEDAEDDEELYQVVCPTCGETIYIDEDTLEEGAIRCAACGESLEFDLSALDADWSESEDDVATEEADDASDDE